MTAERCPVCDRGTCPRETLRLRIDPVINRNIAYAAEYDCEMHRVDWRARAMRAEDGLRMIMSYSEHLHDDVDWLSDIQFGEEKAARACADIASDALGSKGTP